ncbi:MAG: hypothetical protein MAG795_00425 [Candidatus Woesearchaeota archaeon]|nr:hypothetical protein [Candidatus Woesearchaeota archaeon]
MKKVSWVLIGIAGFVVLCFFIGIVALISTADLDFASTVAVIPINGVISTQEDMFFGGSSSGDIVRFIEKADKDPSVRAIVFKINSGGGSAVASDEIGTAIKKTDKLTVSWIRDVGASGAYWIASTTDYIVANRMSMTGSIGVISSYLEAPGFLEDHNITYNRLVGGKYKDVRVPFRKTSEEELRLMQQKVDVVHDIFIQEVADNRDLDKDDVIEAATGIYYIGTEAKQLGLVDELGGKQEVKDYLKMKLDAEDLKFKEYEKKRSFVESFGMMISQLKLDMNLFGMSGVRI